MVKYYLILICILAYQCNSDKTIQAPQPFDPALFSWHEYVIEVFKAKTKSSEPFIIKKIKYNNTMEYDTILPSEFEKDLKLLDLIEINKAGIIDNYTITKSLINDDKLQCIDFTAKNKKLSVQKLRVYYTGNKIQCMSKPTMLYALLNNATVFQNTVTEIYAQNHNIKYLQVYDNLWQSPQIVSIEWVY